MVSWSSVFRVMRMFLRCSIGTVLIWYQKLTWFLSADLPSHSEAGWPVCDQRQEQQEAWRGESQEAGVQDRGHGDRPQPPVHLRRCAGQRPRCQWQCSSLQPTRVQVQKINLENVKCLEAGITILLSGFPFRRTYSQELKLQRYYTTAHHASVICIYFPCLNTAPVPHPGRKVNNHQALGFATSVKGTIYCCGALTWNLQLTSWLQIIFLHN